MRFVVEITGVEVIAAQWGWARGKLKIACSDHVSFAVEDSEQARHAYTLGRKIDVTLIPSRTA